MNYEQSQTNLAVRSKHRTDVRRISETTKLTDVDCGKFLVLALTDNMSLILPNAASCIGGQVDGMVVKNDGAHSLTIVGDQESNDQLVGNYAGASMNVDGDAFGPHPNVPVGFGFSFLSTGTKWCIRVSGSPTSPFDTADLSVSMTNAGNGQVYSTISTETHGIKLSPGLGKGILIDTPNLSCSNMITATSLIGQIGTPNQNNIESIRDVFFETDTDSATVRSNTGKDLVLSCPLTKKVVIDANLDLKTKDLVNAGNVTATSLTATSLTGQIATPDQNLIRSIQNVFFDNSSPLDTASIRSKAGLDLKLSCSQNKKIVINGNLELSENLDLKNKDLVNAGNVTATSVTATSLTGQIATPNQNNIESIRDVFFDSSSPLDTASIRSKAGLDLKLSCSQNKKIVIDGNLELSANLDLNNKDLVNAGNVTATSLTATNLTGIMATSEQNGIERIKGCMFVNGGKLSANILESETIFTSNVTATSVSATNLTGQIATPDQYNIESIRGCIFKTGSNLEVNNIKVYGEVSSASNLVFARRKLSVQSIPSHSDFTISWPDEADNNGITYPSASITCSTDNVSFTANSRGYYLVTWSVEFGNTSANTELSTFIQLGNISSRKYGRVSVSGAPRPVSLSSSATIFMELNYALKIVASHTFGSPVNVPSFQGDSENFNMEITIIKLNS